MNDVVTYAKDLAERAGWTFAQAAGSTIVAAQLTSWHEVKSVAVAAAVAGGASVLSLVKGVLAGTRTGSASTVKAQAVSELVDAGEHVAESAIAKAEAIFPMPAPNTAVPAPTTPPATA